MRNRLRIAVLLGGVALVTPGCGFIGSHGSRPVVTALSEIGAHKRTLVQDTGTLTWPVPALPTSFNVYQSAAGDPAGAAVGEQIMHALLPSTFDTDSAGTPVWNRDLLAAAPKLTVDPEQVVTYRINPRATWSDGTPITWTDFYWQWKSCDGSSPDYPIASASGYDQVKDVARGADDREVKVSFARRYADWQALFAPLYPAGTNKDPGLFASAWRGRMGPTAGPFRLGTIDPANRTLTLVRADRWWGDRAKLDQITYRVVPDDGLVDAYRKGEVDFIQVGTQPDRYRRLGPSPTGEVRRAAGATYRVITLNGGSALLGDLKVRQALARGIDRGAIARAVLSPLGVTPTTLDNHIYLRGQDGYRDNSGEIGRYDAARAAQLLDEAGWRVDGDVRRRDGRALELTMVVPDGVAASRQEAELVAGQLGRINVKVKINPVPPGEFFDGYLAQGHFDLTVFSWTGTAFPASTDRSIYAQAGRDATGRVDIRQNYARVGTEQIDDLLARAAMELDPSRAITIGNQIDTAIWQEVHSLPLYQLPDMVVTRRDLANLGAPGLASVRYQDIGWVKS